MSSSFWLRAAGDDAFAEREDAKEDRKQLVALLSAATKELLLKHVELGRALNVTAAERFCAVLEAILLYGCREPSKGYYRVLAETLRTGVVDSIVKENLQKVEASRAAAATDLGRGRLLVRHALVSKTLAYCVHKLHDSSPTLLGRHYDATGVFLNDEGAPVASLLIALNAVAFDATTLTPAALALDDRFSVPDVLEEMRTLRNAKSTSSNAASASLSSWATAAAFGKKAKKKKSKRALAVVSPVGEPARASPPVRTPAAPFSSIASPASKATSTSTWSSASVVTASGELLSADAVQQHGRDGDVPFGFGVGNDVRGGVGGGGGAGLGGGGQKAALEISPDLLDTLALMDAHSNAWSVTSAPAPGDAVQANSSPAVIATEVAKPVPARQESIAETDMLMLDDDDMVDEAAVRDAWGSLGANENNSNSNAAESVSEAANANVAVDAIDGEGLGDGGDDSAATPPPLHIASGSIAAVNADRLVSASSVSKSAVAAVAVADEWDEALRDDEKDRTAEAYAESPLRRFASSPASIDSVSDSGSTGNKTKTTVFATNAVSVSDETDMFSAFDFYAPPLRDKATRSVTSSPAQSSPVAAVSSPPVRLFVPLSPTASPGDGNASFLDELRKLEDERRKLRHEKEALQSAHKRYGETLPAAQSSGHHSRAQSGTLSESDMLRDDDDHQSAIITIRERPPTAAKQSVSSSDASSSLLSVSSNGGRSGVAAHVTRLSVSADSGDMFFRHLRLVDGGSGVSDGADAILHVMPPPCDITGSIRSAPTGEHYGGDAAQNVQSFVSFLHRPRAATTLAAQHGKCADCGGSVRDARYCTFFARWCCPNCHAGQMSVIPAFVVLRFDFQEYSVCDYAKQFIAARTRTVLLDCAALNAGLFRAAGELRVARLVRRQLAAIDAFMSRSCARSDGYLADLRAVLARKGIAHLVSHDAVFTLRDLLLCHRQRLVPMLKEVFHVYIRHVIQCSECVSHATACAVCGGGHLFAFDLKNALRCDVCGDLLHQRCKPGHRH